MGYRAVALSQVDGAGGESIGLEVAQKLGFGYLNDAIVAQVADEQGVDTSTVAQAERRKSLFDRIAMAAAQGGMQGVSPAPLPYYFDETDTLLSLIREAVRDAAGRGNVVLVAHAACFACADRDDVLRVSITASPSTRAARVAAAQGVGEKDAAKVLRRSDAGRASYLKRVYSIDEESPADYDLVINTDRVSPASAVDLIVGMIQGS